MKFTLSSLLVLGLATLAAAGPVSTDESALEARWHKKADGASCWSKKECKSKVCTWALDRHSWKWKGTCGYPKKLPHLAKCWDNSQCATGRCDKLKSWDHYKVCLYPPVRPGSACKYNSDCTNNSCKSGKCALVPQDGTCLSDSECVSTSPRCLKLTPDATKKICVYPPTGPGKACSYDVDCSNSKCVSGKCALQSQGQACVSASECNSISPRCVKVQPTDTQTVCLYPAAGLGAACGINIDCQSGNKKCCAST